MDLAQVRPIDQVFAQIDWSAFDGNMLLGTSLSTWQVSGGPGQWQDWTEDNAEKLAAHPHRDARSTIPTEIWSEVETHATNPQNYLNPAGVEHDQRYQSDYDLMQQLGLSALRFSIEWARVEPTQGNFDEAELDLVEDKLAALRSRRIEPIICLWHWVEPTWFAQLGSWENSEAVEHYRRYVTAVVRRLGPSVTYWMPLNEPDIYAVASYQQGRFPPQKTSVRSYLKVMRNLAEAHRVAYQEIKAVNPSALIGTSLSNTYYQNGNTSWSRPLTEVSMRVLNQWWLNGWFRRQIADSSDWLGLNYYQRWVLTGIDTTQPAAPVPGVPVSDLGWELYPAGILPLLRDLQSYNKPVIVTEHGLADRHDRYRAWYIAETFRYLAKARKEGVPLVGYLHWSFVDPFEWDSGWWPEFGLVHVDRSTMERHVRPSAYIYADIIQAIGHKP